LLGKVEREHGLVLSSYKQPCLKRRLAVRMRARGVHSYDAYASLLDRAPEEYDLLLDALTINVTKFFRNPEAWRAVAARVVEPLLAGPVPVAIWSAGCASGEEPYSFALQVAERAGPRIKARARIDATDLDPGAIDALRRAEYSAAAVEEVPPPLLSRFFSAGPPYALDRAVAGLVRPRVHDLTREPPPEPPYHLVACRNVVIYFDRATQERIFSRFADALVPGGYLWLGKVETLFGAARERFELIEPRERLFRRL
jgi:chemotaxis protein methyltransferase CheR